MLIKGYDKFPEGYPDIYSETYQEYRSEGDYSFAGDNEIQNGTLAIAISSTILTTANSDGLAYAIAPSIYSLLMFITGFAVIVLRAKK